MSKQKIEDYYFEHNSSIFSEMLGEDEDYQRLKKAKMRKLCKMPSAKRRGSNTSP